MKIQTRKRSQLLIKIHPIRAVIRAHPLSRKENWWRGNPRRDISANSCLLSLRLYRIRLSSMTTHLNLPEYTVTPYDVFALFFLLLFFKSSYFTLNRLKSGSKKSTNTFYVGFPLNPEHLFSVKVSFYNSVSSLLLTNPPLDQSISALESKIQEKQQAIESKLKSLSQNLSHQISRSKFSSLPRLP